MNKHFDFDKWFEICDELYRLFWSCVRSCTEKSKKPIECLDECVEKVQRHGMEKYRTADLTMILPLLLSTYRELRYIVEMIEIVEKIVEKQEYG